MSRLVSYIQKVASGKMVLGFFIPAMAVYSLMLLNTIPQVEQYAPGMKLFDLSPSGYSHHDALELLATLGVQGRDIYLYRQIPLDLVYPGVFAVSCCLLLAWLFGKSLSPESGMFYLCFIPLAAGLFDYLENICIVQMLLAYPDVTGPTVATASTFTILKSVFTSAFFLLLIVGAVLFWKKKRRLIAHC